MFECFSTESGLFERLYIRSFCMSCNDNTGKKHALFFASVLKDMYRINNTFAVIGRGLEKNENFIYNCVIISLIKDINPSQSIQ